MQPTAVWLSESDTFFAVNRQQPWRTSGCASTSARHGAGPGSIDFIPLPQRPLSSGAPKAQQATRHAELNAREKEIDARVKAAKKREGDVAEREAAGDAKDAQLAESETAVKDRQAECRQVETENKRQGDKLEARAKALRDAAEL